MYVDSCTFLDDYGHKRSRHLLRSSYRQDGKVKHDTLGNISSCSDQEITAIKLALKHKGCSSWALCNHFRFNKASQLAPCA